MGFILIYLSLVIGMLNGVFKEWWIWKVKLLGSYRFFFYYLYLFLSVLINSLGINERW